MLTYCIFNCFDGCFQAGISVNSGLFTLLVNALHCTVIFKDFDFSSLWIKVYTILGSLHGLNLVLTAQTIPTLDQSTVAVLRMLGAVTCYIGAAILSQAFALPFISSVESPALGAFGYLMATLAITSIPVWMDLKALLRRGASTSSFVSNSFLAYILLSAAMATYILG